MPFSTAGCKTHTHTHTLTHPLNTQQPTLKHTCGQCVSAGPLADQHTSAQIKPGDAVYTQNTKLTDKHKYSWTHTHTHRLHKLASRSLYHHRAPPPHLCPSQTPQLWAAGVRECPGQLAWAGMALAVAGVERNSSKQMTGGTEERKGERRNTGEQERKRVTIEKSRGKRKIIII